jgi:hypothetical protein
MIESCLVRRDATGTLPDLSWAPDLQDYFDNNNQHRFGDMVKSWIQLSKDCQLSSEPTNAVPVILSCEFAYNTLAEDAILSHLKYCLEHFDVKIVIYIRRVDEHCNADLVQTLRAGLWARGDNFYKLKSNRRHNIIEQHKSLPRLIHKWASHFGKGNIVVRPFEAQSLLQSNVVADFFSILGLTVPEIYQDTAQNKAVPYDFLLYFAERYGGPLQRSTKSKKLFDLLLTSIELDRLQVCSSKYAYSPQERLEMIEAVSEQYSSIGAYIGASKPTLFLERLPAPTDEWQNLANLDTDRIPEFDKLIENASILI